MIEKIEKLRNIAFVGHGGSGKTSLAEAMLYNSGVIKRLGRVEDGNTAMDFEPEEIKRSISLSSSFHQCNWKKHTVCLIDTPGDQNFFSDTRSAIQAADGAVVVIDAVDGVKVQTEQAWDFVEEYNLPSIIFINKLDRERADFTRTFLDAVNCFQPKPIILQIPIGSEAGFKGVIDLVRMKAYLYDGKDKANIVDIPSDLKDKAEEERENLIENVVESDDDLLERYLEGESLSDDELNTALRKGTLSRTFVPVMCGSATKNVGVDLLQDFVVQCMPSPIDRGKWTAIDPLNESEIECSPDPDEPFSALIFKTVADPFAGRLSIFRVVSGSMGSDGNFFNVNKDSKERYNQLLRLEGKEQKPVTEAGPGSIVAVAKLKDAATGDTICNESRKVRFKSAEPLSPLISFAILPKSKGDEDKIFISLSKLLEEDASLQLTRNAETKQILLSGLGQIHIDVNTEKLKRKFNVEAQLTTPKIPYKETVSKKIRVQGRHKKQTGGHGQFGDCWIQLEPLPRGQGFEFVDKIVGGRIPKQYIPAVEKGIIESSQKGVLSGVPCVDFRVILDDGSFHAVDSSEMAFKIAGSIAFKKAVTGAGPILLEPIMNVSITTPDEYMGDIMGDLNSRRGRVLGMDTKGKNQIIKAHVPMAELLAYAADLRSITGGRGIFSMELSHYDEVPAQISQRIIEEINDDKE